MTRKIWVLGIASVFVLSILLAGQGFAAGEKIVVFRDGTSPQVQQAIVAAVALLLNPLHPEKAITVVHTLSFINALAIVVLNPKQVDQAVQLLLNYTTPLGIHPVQEVADDPAISVNPISPAPFPSTQTYDWGLKHIRVDVAHQEMPQWNGQGVKVAILDTGVGPHGELTIVDGYNALPDGYNALLDGCIDGVKPYSDNNGHGTHIAGIIAASAKNNVGIIGAAPRAQIVAVKVLNCKGKGRLSNLIKGLQWVYNYEGDPPIRLVNMSLGFSNDNSALKTAIQKLYDKRYDNGIQGAIMVASAGNRCSDDPGQDESGGDAGEDCDIPQTTTDDTVKYPARYQWSLAVTATTIGNQMASYSVAGSKVDTTAPGGELEGTRIFSTCVPQLLKDKASPYDCPWGYGDGSGTSQAAAHVTGTLALLLQQQWELPVSQVLVQLCQTATILKNPDTGVLVSGMKQGCGLINAECLLAPTLPQCPTQ
jgi:subtilisin family serine protease